MATAAFLQKAYLAYFGRPVDTAGALAFQNSSEAAVIAAFSASPESQSLYGSNFGLAQVDAIYQMLFGRSAEPAGLAYWVNQVAIGALQPAGAAIAILEAGRLTADATAVENKLAASAAFSAGLDTTSEILGYSGDASAASARDFLHTVTATVATQAQVDAAIVAATTKSVQVGTGQTFTLTDSLIAGVKSMVLTGDQDVRIDMTKTANQITGLDLNGNGAIANDGKENAIGVKAAAGYVAVDAYTRLENGVVNETNLSTVFKGDIKYDGTGFAGNGTATNGNIVLGGLGADTILGGIGNDFLAGGGVALSRVQAALAEWVAAGKPTSTFVAPIDILSGGRNADFLFAELSLLTNTDGNQVFIDGGATADSTSAANGQSSQDSDWLLLQASDDDERIEVVLTENAGTVGTTVVNDGTLTTRAGQYATLRDIENIDASGNTYGFLKNLSTAVGGAPTGAVNANNNGIGSSGQLNITGSLAANIIIGGYDNDAINAGAGNDIVMGGNLNMLIDPNLVGLNGNNDGRDELTGGSGDDEIVFEADGGIIEGGATQSVDDGVTTNDTLWLTANSLGAVKAADVAVVPVAASALTTDSTLRFDLAAGKTGGLANASGYGGADKDAANGYTADQTNYTAANAGLRVQVQDMESVIATGLGQIDYKAAGGNTAADLTFTNQQNFFAYNGDLDLRGTYSSSVQTATNFTITLTIAGAPTVFTATYDGVLTTAQATQKFMLENAAVVGTATAIANNAASAVSTSVSGVNTLYASIGNDKLEGRTGGTLTFDATGTTTATGDNRDKLSGNLGNDDFIFNLLASGGDGVDVIHRQTDANGDNIWDGGFQRDFGLGNTSSVLNAKLTLTVPSNDLLPLVEAVQFVNGGVTFKMSGLSSTTYTGFVANLNTALKANVGTANNVAVLNADNSVTITDPDGSAFSLSTQGWFFVDGGIPPNGTADWKQVVGAPEALKIQDRIIFQAYEDRADGEKVDDGSTTGSSISLGLDAYAEDLVVDFRNGSTWLAEDQSYALTFTNLTTEDKVALSVNGVTYTLTVGVDLDGNEIANEEFNNGQGGASSQAQIQSNFLTRMEGFINSFMDDDTAAGKVNAVATNGTTLTLTQVDYNGEETVFMRTPSVVLTNGSGGELATVSGLNNSGSEVQLLDFDGRNAELNFSNVLFLGNTDINRSTFQTALTAGGTITGSEAVVIDGGTNTLQSTLFGGTTVIADNTATNSFLRTDFTVHGDDLLITAAGADVINGGTGDDRVLGSIGTDTIDGGKSFYAVKVLGEAQARVYVLNQWEATNPTLVAALQAITTAGGTISSINRVGDAETGEEATAAANSVGTAEVYNDTLQFQQADFSANTKFTVVLNGFTGTTATTVAFPNAGAGQVLVDDAGNNTTDGTTTFTNFENIRTVSGTGNAVAGDGQGNDTLDVSALSTAAGGVSYDLTSRVETPVNNLLPSSAGDVRYSKVADTVADAAGETATFKFPDENDFATHVIKVDGVESVISGTGNDLLMIDQSEAAKNNSFTASLGLDRIEYLNDYNTTTTLDLNNSGAFNAADQLIAEDYSEPTVTIKLDNVAAVTTATTGTDTVTMTGGRVGSTVAVDSLTAVERIALNGNTAEGRAEADVLDVTALTTGATVDFTNNQVRDLAGVVHVTVEQMAEIENVWADGNDTVIVASSSAMSGANAREDVANGTLPQDITYASFLDFDELTAATAKRVAFVSQTTTMITDVVNQAEYTFNLSKTGSAVDTDTVDYSASVNALSVAVELDATKANQYVMVDGDITAGFDVGSRVDSNDRIDVLTSVERIVASQGESILDLTSSTKSLEIKYNTPALADRVATSAANLINAYDVTQIRISDMSTASPLSRTYLEYTDAADVVDVAGNVSKAATWNRIEGSDNAERVIVASTHSTVKDTYNLRGGANEVKYNELTKSITLTLQVTDWAVTTDADGVDNILGNIDDLGYNTGVINGTVQFQDGTGNGVEKTPYINAVGAEDFITSYTANNGIAAGSLRIAASQDAEDTIKLGGLDSKVYLISQTGTTDNQITLKLGSGTAENSVILTGFELVSDAVSNDVYNFGSLLQAAAGLNMTDVATDHDTIKVGDDAAANPFNGGAGTTTISLQSLNADSITYGLVAATGVAFDFDVLDLTSVTSAAITTVLGATVGGPGEGVAAGVAIANIGTTDEVVFGKLLNMATVSNFESLVFTQDTITENGTTYILNATGNSLTAGAKTVALSNGTNTLSFGGTVLEQATDGSLRAATALNATSGVTVTTTDTAGEGVNLTGGNGNDSLTGAAGADTLRGGSGVDTLNGSFTPAVNEVDSYTISANAGLTGGAGRVVTINGVSVTEGAVVAAVAVAEDDADAIGAAFVRVWNATPGSFTVNGATAAPNTIGSVTYDALTNVLSFNYVAGMDATGILPAVAGTGAAAVSAVVNTNFVPQAESADTFVFEATGALNGADILNNVDASDTFNFSAFLGNANGGGTVVAGGDVGTVGFAGLVVAAATDMVTAFNKASLSTSDFVSGAVLTAGKFALVDGDSAVFAVSADVDGAADVTVNAWNLYYVNNGATVGASDLTVTLVGTVNSTAELSAAAVGAML